MIIHRMIAKLSCYDRMGPILYHAMDDRRSYHSSSNHHSIHHYWSPMGSSRVNNAPRPPAISLFTMVGCPIPKIFKKSPKMAKKSQNHPKMGVFARDPCRWPLFAKICDFFKRGFPDFGKKSRNLGSPGNFLDPPGTPPTIAQYQNPEFAKKCATPGFATSRPMEPSIGGLAEFSRRRHIHLGFFGKNLGINQPHENFGTRFAHFFCKKVAKIEKIDKNRQKLRFWPQKSVNLTQFGIFSLCQAAACR